MKVTTETSVSIGLVVTLLGGAAWLTALWASNTANSKAIESLTHSREREWQVLSEIRERLIRIEDKVASGGEQKHAHR